MKTFVLVCISVQILSLSAKILPKNFPAFCSISEPNYNKCMENAFQKMGPHFLKGIRAINFPSLHPLIMPSFSINRKLGENVLVLAELKNLQFHGYDKMELRKFNFDPKELQGKVVLYIPYIDFKMEFNVFGQIVNFNISNEGFISGNTSGLDLEFNLKLKRINKVGIDYLAVDKFEAKGSIDDAQIKVIAKDPAAQVTSDFIDAFINAHSKEVLQMIDPIYEESLASYYGSFVERFLSSVPADEILPE